MLFSTSGRMRDELWTHYLLLGNYQPYSPQLDGWKSTLSSITGIVAMTRVNCRTRYWRTGAKFLTILPLTYSFVAGFSFLYMQRVVFLFILSRLEQTPIYSIIKECWLEEKLNTSKYFLPHLPMAWSVWGREISSLRCGASSNLWFTNRSCPTIRHAI